jgi:hypothetical protein
MKKYKQAPRDENKCIDCQITPVIPPVVICQDCLGAKKDSNK